MKTNSKKITLSGIAALTVCLLLSVLWFIQPVNAEAAEAATQSGFTMEETAEVRQYGFVGIRFTVKVTDRIENAQYGTLIVPEDLLDGELTLETSKVLNIPTAKWQDDSTYTAVLAGKKDEEGNYTDLSEDYYNRPLAARGYVTGTVDGEEVTYYTENTVTRSIGYVASMNVEDGDENEILNNIAAETRYEFAIPKNLTLDINCQGVGESVAAGVSMGGIVSTKTVDIVIDDDTVAKLQDGNLVALKVGTTSAKLTYTKADGTKIVNTFNVTVNEVGHHFATPDGDELLSCLGGCGTEVVVSNGRLTKDVTHDGSTYSFGSMMTKVIDLRNDLPDDFGTVTSLIFDVDTELSVTTSTAAYVPGYVHLDNLQWNISNTAANFGTQTLVAYSDAYPDGYDVSVLVVTKVIRTVDDYNKIATTSTWVNNGGYFELGNDITPETEGGNIDCVPLQSAFKGTIDGCGYVIDGLKAISATDGRGGFAYGFSDAAATIKNIGFTNVDLPASLSTKFLGQSTAGTYQNIYFSADDVSDSGFMLVQSMATAVVIDNVFADYTNATGSASYLLGDGRNNGLDSADIYGVGSISGWAYSEGTSNTGVLAGHYFGSYALLKADSTALSAVSSWANECEYWHINPVTGKVTFGNTAVASIESERNTWIQLSGNDFWKKYDSASAAVSDEAIVTMAQKLGAEALYTLSGTTAGWNSFRGTPSSETGVDYIEAKYYIYATTAGTLKLRIDGDSSWGTDQTISIGWTEVKFVKNGDYFDLYVNGVNVPAPTNSYYVGLGNSLFQYAGEIYVSNILYKTANSTSGSQTSDHTHTYDQTVVKYKYFASSSCTEPSLYYYSCACGAKGSETFEVGDGVGHNLAISSAAVAPTCTTAGKTATESCSRCAYTSTATTIPATKHTFGDITDRFHTGTCIYCGNYQKNVGSGCILVDYDTSAAWPYWGTDATQILDIRAQLPADFGTVTSFKLKDNDTELGEFGTYATPFYQDGYVVLISSGKTTISAVSGEQTFVAYSDTYTDGYEVTVTVITKIIETVDDLNNWGAISTALNYGGYFELGNDLKQDDGITLNSWNTNSYWQTAENYKGFSGTFDGCGYTIDGLKMVSGATGFVGTMTSTGTVKNIGFTNVDPSAITAATSFFGTTTHGNIDNVFIHYASTIANLRTMTVAGYTGVTTDISVNNLFVDASDATASTDACNIVPDMANSDAYGVVPADGNAGWYCSWEHDAEGEYYYGKMFAGYSAFKADTAAFEAVSAWADECEWWYIDSATGTVRFGRTAKSNLPNADILFGKTGYSIFYTNASGDIKTAGDFVKTHIAAATGATLGWQADSSSVTWTVNQKFIVIGDTALAEKAGVTLDENYAYQITVKGKSIFILASDSANYQLAVLKLLEEVLGMNYISSDVVIYEKDTGLGDWYLPESDIYGAAAAVELRTEPQLWDDAMENYYGLGYSDPASTMMMPTRVLTDNGDGTFTATSATADKETNGDTSIHTSFYYLSPTVYGTEHPNWFSTNEIDASSGSDVSVTSTQTQLCYTAHGNADDLLAMQTIVANKIVALASNSQDDVRNVVQFGAQDINIRCGCDACQAIEAEYGTLAAANIIFTNKVGELVEEKLRAMGLDERADELVILFFAYQHASTPPAYSEEMVLRDNVGVRIASSKSLYAWTFEDFANATNAAEIQGWAKLTGNIYYYLYNHNWSGFFGPCNTFERTKANLQFVIDNGAKGIYIQSSMGENANYPGFAAFKLYLEGQLMVDMSREYDDIKSNFFKYYYGEGGEKMEQFFDELVTYMNAQRDAGVEDFYGKIVNQNTAQQEYWTLDQLMAWETICNEAIAALDTSDPNYEIYKKHIMVEQLFPRYMIARYCAVDMGDEAYANRNAYDYRFYWGAESFEETKQWSWSSLSYVYTYTAKAELINAYRQAFADDCAALGITKYNGMDTALMTELYEYWGITPNAANATIPITE